MAEAQPWSCKECGRVLGWQGEAGLVVDPEAVERYTLPALVEEIWVTCKHCAAVQIWRARAEMPPLVGGRWRMRERPQE